MKTFWMLWRDGDNAPAIQHHQIDTAIVEAERIALRHPGSRVYLLKAVDYCIIASKPVIWAGDMGEGEDL